VTADQTHRSRAAREIASDLARLSRRASRLVNVEPVAISDLRADPGGIDRLLGHLLPVIVEQYQRRRGDITNARMLVSMAVDVVDLEDEWRQCRQRDAQRRRDGLAHSVARMRSLRTEEDLAEQICEEACRACGSDRTLFAWIGEGIWLPYRHLRAGTGPAHSPPAAAEPLSGLPIEQTVIESRQTSRISSADDRPRPVAIRQLMRRSSFAIAPVLVEDSVIGLIYAAESASSPWHDRDLTSRLDRFADCIGRYFELTMQLRHLDAQSARMRQGLSSLEQAVTAADTSVDLVQLVGREQAGPATTGKDPLTPPLVRFDNEFTPRERDVMTLLAVGLNNKEIGEQLAIAESTVKSHLQQMLRKAGAVNRSELIGQFYATSPPVGAP
jgi:DNA-binding CsgD family transcriptional regulator